MLLLVPAPASCGRRRDFLRDVSHVDLVARDLLVSLLLCG
jgi:hypothetical protein